MERYKDPVTKARHKKEYEDIMFEIKYAVNACVKNYNFTHQNNTITIKDVIHELSTQTPR